MNKILLRILLGLLLIADTGYSFLQHKSAPLDGDLAEIVVPSDEFKPLMSDPAGMQALFEGKSYSSPNRYFAHLSTSLYFHTAPVWLQRFFSPVDSVYIASGLAKTLIQIMILFLLAFFVCGHGRVWKTDFLLAAVILAPFFQAEGYNRYMGIIDQSVSYTFFYALPLGLLLLFFLPFFLIIYHKVPIRIPAIVQVLLLLLAIFVSLNGPLIPGVVLVVCLLYFLYHFGKFIKALPQQKVFAGLRSVISEIPKPALFFFVSICIFCLYSLYIGRYNAVNDAYYLPLAERYLRIPEGLFNWLFQKPGNIMLLMAGIANLLLIRFAFKEERRSDMLNLLKWIGIFALVYILLLPVGGYRDYRQYIIRYDTIMPLTLCLMFYFALTALHIIKAAGKRLRVIYLAFLCLIVSVFTFADTLSPEKNACERAALLDISGSTEDVVELDRDCTVLSWEKIRDPRASRLNAELLKRWNIISEDKLYVQK
jgi:hypothetical protein